MNRYTFHIFSLSILCLLCGCKKNDQSPFFDGVPALSISGESRQGIISDSLEFSFGVLNSQITDSVINLQVRAIGVPSGADRDFLLAINPAQSTAMSDEYTFPSHFVIPAGQVSTTIPVQIKRSERIESTEAKLVIEVKENANFIPGPRLEVAGQPTSGPRFTLIWTSQLTKPAAWDGFPFAALYFCLGDYSKTKHQIIIDATGITTYDDVMVVSDTWYYIYNKCIEWLDSYNTAHPNAPLRDENGEIVEFPNF